MKMVVRFWLRLVRAVAGLALKVVSYIMGPVLWFLIGCLMWSIWRQDWLDVGLLSGIFVACVLAVFIVAFLAVIGKHDASMS